MTNCEMECKECLYYEVDISSAPCRTCLDLSNYIWKGDLTESSTMSCRIRKSSEDCSEIKQDCDNCLHKKQPIFEYPCKVCDSSDEWEPKEDKETDTGSQLIKLDGDYDILVGYGTVQLLWRNKPVDDEKFSLLAKVLIRKVLQLRKIIDERGRLQMSKKRGFEVVREDYKTLPEGDIKLPLRGTKTSAGYDFYATEDLVILPQTIAKFKTDIKAYMEEDEVLLMFIRSSLGVKKDLMIANTVGVIDSDYYSNPDNDGNMMVALRNLRPSIGVGKDSISLVTDSGDIVSIPVIEDLTEINTIHIPKGERVIQGVFVKFEEADNCNSDTDRTGGVGSTGKQ